MMKTRHLIVLFTIAIVIVIGACAPALETGADETRLDVAAGDWPHWRGATRDGVAADKSAPMKWSKTENIRWKVEVPGLGNSTPIVWGDRIYLTTAIETEQEGEAIELPPLQGGQRSGRSNRGTWSPWYRCHAGPVECRRPAGAVGRLAPCF